MLSIIPVPVGNKDDITIRGMKLLEGLQVFFCEDTRNLQKLCRLYNIDWRTKKFYSLTSFSNKKSLLFYREIIAKQDCGMVSDAGTPGLSDPGKELVRLCWDREIPFEVLPGATALIPAVVGSYCDTSKFVYLGFPPTKKGRQTFLQGILQYDYPVYIYESIHRVKKTLIQLESLGFTGTVFLFRELSKAFEQKEKGTIQELLGMIEEGKIIMKGEFVLGFINK